LKFEIISASGGYRARIVDGSEEIIFVSPIYESKAHAKSVIALVSNAAPSAEIEDNS